MKLDGFEGSGGVRGVKTIKDFISGISVLDFDVPDQLIVMAFMMPVHRGEILVLRACYVCASHLSVASQEYFLRLYQVFWFLDRLYLLNSDHVGEFVFLPRTLIKESIC